MCHILDNTVSGVIDVLKPILIIVLACVKAVNNHIERKEKQKEAAMEELLPLLNATSDIDRIITDALTNVKRMKVFDVPIQTVQNCLTVMGETKQYVNLSNNKNLMRYYNSLQDSLGDTVIGFDGEKWTFECRYHLMESLGYAKKLRRAICNYLNI